MGEKIEEGTFQNLSSLLSPEMTKCVLLQRHEDLSIEISQMLHACKTKKNYEASFKIHSFILSL